MSLLPQKYSINLKENIIVIEYCAKCDTHKWNTRHDEAKYAEVARIIADKILANHPDTIILFNQVPKKWHK